MDADHTHDPHPNDNHQPHRIEFHGGVVQENGILWDTNNVLKLQILEAESTVLVSLLMENPTLIEMIERGDSKAACLTYINENF